MPDRSRPMLTVRGVDPEMGRAIKPLSAPEPVDAPGKEKAREGSGVVTPVAASTLDRPAPRKTTALRQAQETDRVAAGPAACDAHAHATRYRARAFDSAAQGQGCR